MYLRLAAKRQLFIPSQLRQKLGWKPGLELEISYEGHSIRIESVSAQRSATDMTVVGRRFQITIPVKVCRELEIAESDELLVSIEEGGLKLRHVPRIQQLSMTEATKITSDAKSATPRTPLDPLESAGLRKVWSRHRKRRSKKLRARIQGELESE